MIFKCKGSSGVHCVQDRTIGGKWKRTRNLLWRDRFDHSSHKKTYARHSWDDWYERLDRGAARSNGTEAFSHYSYNKTWADDKRDYDSSYVWPGSWILPNLQDSPVATEGEEVVTIALVLSRLDSEISMQTTGELTMRFKLRAQV